MRSLNPATGELIREYTAMDPRQLEQAVIQAAEAFALWREAGLGDRTALLARVATLLRAGKADYARLMTQEMGKPIRQAEAEVEKCAWLCEEIAKSAEQALLPARVPTEARASYVRFDPLGPVLAIMPWNFPFWQVFRFAAPALAAGNVVVLKHASGVTGCGLAIEELFRRAGAEAGVVTSLVVGNEHVDRLIADPRVAAVTLTGSVRAGRAVGATAGHHIKKMVLELGGSDPFLVLSDADIGRAAEIAVQARTQNTGQSCIAAKRFILERGVAERFEELFVERTKKLRIGDPMDPATDIGPLAREDLLHELHRQVVESQENDAVILLGGSRVDRPGFFYVPTVLSATGPGIVAFDDETFGPVAALCRADDERHAVSLANASRFGLGASVWTADRERGERIAARLEAGNVFVNALVRSDPRLPFGGVKDSGFGRELGLFGLREFCNVKTVWVE
jgi:succinate-semialdehyde dehydrogenase/glutarate-semialdehyde dehydrogenase